MKPLSNDQIKAMVDRLGNDLFMLQTNLSVIDQSEDSYDDEGGYLPEVFTNRTATSQAVDALNMAIENLKDIK